MILQKSVPYDIDHAHRLPGVAPMAMDDWIWVDDAFSGQMAERDRLIRNHRPEVIAQTPDADAALPELLSEVLGALPPGYTRDADVVVRPDGVRVVIDEADVLGTLGRIVQCDLCLMQKPDGAEEHVLTAAVLCFPASWLLAEKIGRPLIGIHDRVAPYDDKLAPRVQRLFDGLQVGRPLWRHNALTYHDPTLFQPRSAMAPRDVSDLSGAGYLRTERQCLIRLRESRAVVFSIHTFVVSLVDVRRPKARQG